MSLPSTSICSSSWSFPDLNHSAARSAINASTLVAAMATSLTLKTAGLGSSLIFLVNPSSASREKGD